MSNEYKGLLRSQSYKDYRNIHNNRREYNSLIESRSDPNDTSFTSFSFDNSLRNEDLPDYDKISLHKSNSLSNYDVNKSNIYPPLYSDFKTLDNKIFVSNFTY